MINAVADEQVVPVGENVLYTLTVTNTSSDTAFNVTVSASLPLSATIIGVSGTCGVFGNSVTCSLGGLVGGSFASATIVASPTVQGAFGLSATVSSSTPDLNTANNSISVVIEAVSDGDVDGDGVITQADLDLAIESFGSTAGDDTYNFSADLNGDGIVDLTDIARLAAGLAGGA